MKSNAGFTLIEMLIALVVTMILMGGAYSVFMSQQKNTVVQTDVSDIQQTLRSTMDFLVRDIRMAGYPGPGWESVGNFGITEVGLSDYSGNPNSGARDQGFIRFSWDMNDNNTLNAGETVSYSLSDNEPNVAPGSVALMRQLDSWANRQPIAGYVTNIGFAFAIDIEGDLKNQLERTGNNNVIWALDTDNDGFWNNLDTNDDGRIDAADLGGAAPGTIVGTATGIPVRPGDIRAVRIWLLGRSLAPDNTYLDGNVYVVGASVLQPNDNFRRRLLERTVLCRNMGLEK